MKVFGLKEVEVVIDRRCDVCGDSLWIDCDGTKLEEMAVLDANWGYGSKMDGIRHHLELCETCFKIALAALKDHRRSINMFDESQNLPDDNFGVNR